MSNLIFVVQSQFNLIVSGMFLMIIPSLFVSCTKPDLDRSYLTSNPCSAPCWQGVTPGITDNETAFSIISNLNFIEQDSIKRTVQQDTSLISGYVYRTKSGGSGSIGLSDGIVNRIDLRPGATPPLFRDIMEVFGPPESVLINEKSDADTCYDVNLFYPAKGAWIRGGGCYSNNPDFAIEISTGSSPNRANVFPEIPVVSLTFFQSKQNLDEALISSLFFDATYVQYIITYSVPWSGYGTYPIPPPVPTRSS